MFKRIWASGTSFQTQHFINSMNNVNSVLHDRVLQVHLSCLLQFHLKSQRMEESQCQIVPSASAQFQWWFEVPVSLVLGSLMFRARLRRAKCSIDWTSVPMCRCTDVGETEYECKKFVSWKIHCRVGLQTRAIIDLFFPVTDVEKLVRIIFRSNQSSKSNLAIYRAAARITLSISKSDRVICFWTSNRAVFPCDLAEICFTF